MYKFTKCCVGAHSMCAVLEYSMTARNNLDVYCRSLGALLNKARSGMCLYVGTGGVFD